MMTAKFDLRASGVVRVALAFGLGALALGLAFATADPAASIEGRAEVVSGGALHIDGRYLRLEGIVAPAHAQTCQGQNGQSVEIGRAAATRLRQLLSASAVSCEVSRWHEGEGVLVGTCAAGATDVAGLLIDEGLAWPVSSVGDYADRARRAERARRGLWAMSCRSGDAWRVDAGGFFGHRSKTY